MYVFTLSMNDEMMKLLLQLLALKLIIDFFRSLISAYNEKQRINERTEYIKSILDNDSEESVLSDDPCEESEVCEEKNEENECDEEENEEENREESEVCEEEYEESEPCE